MAQDQRRGKKPSEGKLLYHITRLDNLPSILKDGLLPRAELERSKTGFADIADQGILSKRKEYQVNLSECVPFHFFAKTPFDGDVCRKYGAENMAIITIPRKLHENNDFYIIPSHPLDREEPDIYPYDKGFSLISWEILDLDRNFRDYHIREVKLACMAECVAQYRFPPECFAVVYLPTQAAYEFVKQMDGFQRVKNWKVARYMFP